MYCINISPHILLQIYEKLFLIDTTFMPFSNKSLGEDVDKLLIIIANGPDSKLSNRDPLMNKMKFHLYVFAMRKKIGFCVK